MYLKPALLIIFFHLYFTQVLVSQEKDTREIKPTFTPFTGIVYKMPIVEKRRGNLISKRIKENYFEGVTDYPIIGNITLNQINIPETSSDNENFPQTDRSIGLCMILNSTMTIDIEGCYEFILNSDDGSILWINGKEYLNNDGGHQMQMKKDTFPLDEGTYDIRLWYFQGMPDRFGFQFDAKLVKAGLPCSEDPILNKLEFQNELLFDFGKYSLENTAKEQLKKIISNLEMKDINSIEIIGHTDNIGSARENIELSNKRAQAISLVLEEYFDKNEIDITIIGKGESEPKESNNTEEGRRANRRVVIIFR